MKKHRGDFILGSVLLLLFLLQDWLHWKMSWLEELQVNETYRIVSGCLLAAYILFQWYLSYLRMRGRKKPAVIHYSIHKKVGIWAPLVFYIHSTNFGFAYLFILSTIYFANVAVGLLNADILRIRQRWFTYGWMIVHVSLSVLIVMIMLYHLWIVVSYH